MLNKSPDDADELTRRRRRGLKQPGCAVEAGEKPQAGRSKGQIADLIEAVDKGNSKQEHRHVPSEAKSKP